MAQLKSHRRVAEPVPMAKPLEAGKAELENFVTFLVPPGLAETMGRSGTSANLHSELWTPSTVYVALMNSNCNKSSPKL